MVELLIVLVILVVLVLVISAPLRAEARWKGGVDSTMDRRGPGDDAQPPRRELADLEAAREAKYREIRDTQLDHATGKLSDEDFKALDHRLRTEALGILDRIDVVVGESASGRDHTSERP